MNNHLYFMKIVEEGNISKAADKLFIAQPSLSKYLKKLEEDVGYTLLNRETRPLTLTEHGEIYYNYLQQGIERQIQLEQDLANTSNVVRGTINLGLTFWRSSFIVPYIISTFNRTYPNIKVNLFEGSHQYLMSMLNSGQTELSLMHTPNPYTGVKYEHIITEKILLLVNKNNPILDTIHFKLDKINTLTIDEFKLFKQEHFISLTKGQNLRQQTDNFFMEYNIDLPILLETSNIMTAKQIVENGDAITFAPGLSFVNRKHYSNIVFFNIDTVDLGWNLEFGFRSYYQISRPVRLFIDFIKETIIEMPY